MIRLTVDQQIAEVENHSVLLPLQLVLNPSDSPNAPPIPNPNSSPYPPPHFLLPQLSSSLPSPPPPFSPKPTPSNPLTLTLTLTLPALIPSHRM